ncbi:dihydroxyacetone kinase family protein [Devosia sediminis]|uniref:Dihydroxyacetone kinase subunit DhaK n=1 Tax=Devosia sediminis TaxID=2798801 RepID=A0A934MMM0_9HYPH|nr:dihydroxyacetone kinase family protein [Devosia sediminis]MBJ3785851.1 dihydroxyacetone kinase subunit DhaK [Devosia sediminis]
MKKLINDPRHLVREVLEGLVDATPGLALLDTENVLIRHDDRPAEDRPVAVLSGGGSGHEPGHAGYVGRGMLAGAIAGDVFTSPSVDAVLAAIKATAGPRGAVLIVKNYTGDRLNFGLAAEMATAQGIPTEIVVVADDVALRKTVAPERRRGIAGTVLVHKIAGNAADRGLPVEQVAQFARAAAEAVGTMGVALGACTVPSVGRPGFNLADDEIEIGLGIHGEKGVERVHLQPADVLVDRLVQTILDDKGIAPGQRVVVLVNGLGATPPIELAIVARRALARCREVGLIVERLYSGVYLSALDMPGCSISILPVDDSMLQALDAPTEVRSWSSDGRIAPERRIVAAPATAYATIEHAAGPQARQIQAVALAVAAELAAQENLLADLDSQAGDGDLGASMARGADAIRGLPESAFNTPESACMAIADALRRAIAGSSGPFYAVGLVRAASSLQGKAAAMGQDWSAAFTAAVEAVEQLGGARIGNRTMVDALRPAADTWANELARGTEPLAAFVAAVAAAEAGAEATASMHPSLGRSAYLGDRAIGVKDGGAVAVAIWLKAISDRVSVVR